MANEVSYMLGRQKYARPQAMLFANNPGRTVIEDGVQYRIPDGYEIGADSIDPNNEFLILSDDNRGDITIKPERIEKRERMVNGRMRSYHIADKVKIDTSWDMLPSRAFAELPYFDSTSGISTLSTDKTMAFTTDGGAGGADIYDWYQRYPGSFFVYLAYDKFTNFGRTDEAYANMQMYNEVIEVFFADFQHVVVKRGGSTHDFWNVSFSLEEV